MGIPAVTIDTRMSERDYPYEYQWGTSEPPLVFSITADRIVNESAGPNTEPEGQNRSLPACVHTDDHWSWGNLLQFNEDKTVCPLIS